MPIKTFRGLLADGGQDTIILHTNTGSTGYRIAKFEIITTAPGTTLPEAIVKIYKVPQTTVDGGVDMSDQTLLAVAFQSTSSGAAYGLLDSVIVFDSEVFNQDIYITAKDVSSQTNATNYYIELEQVRLDLNQNTVATLKDIRNVTAPV